jgi:hypothetical protein
MERADIARVNIRMAFCLNRSTLRLDEPGYFAGIGKDHIGTVSRHSSGYQCGYAIPWAVGEWHAAQVRNSCWPRAASLLASVGDSMMATVSAPIAV